MGTGGFVCASALTSWALALYFKRQGWVEERGGKEGGLWERIGGTTLVSALAETLPVPEGMDNLLVVVVVLMVDWAVCRGRGVEF